MASRWPLLLTWHSRWFRRFRGQIGGGDGRWCGGWWWWLLLLLLLLPLLSLGLSVRIWGRWGDPTPAGAPPPSQLYPLAGWRPTTGSAI